MKAKYNHCKTSTSGYVERTKVEIFKQCWKELYDWLM